jgi:hypothetical protein
MTSPFPGVDPYLQRRWSDIHSTVVPAIKESLQPHLPPGLKARSEERVVLTRDDRRFADYRTDVAAVSVPAGDRRRPDAAPAGASTAVLDRPPVVAEFYTEPEIDTFVQIIDTTAGGRVVTAIELLSPKNKAAGDASRDYQRQVRDYAAAGVNLVEIDLIRGPRTRLRVRRDDLPPDQRTPYLICVRRGAHPARWECYPIGLRERVPRVPVPLRDGDADVVLDLQPLLDRAYVAGGHDDIDYAVPPQPRLSPVDEAWADALLRSAGLRG